MRFKMRQIENVTCAAVCTLHSICLVVGRERVVVK